MDRNCFSDNRLQCGPSLKVFEKSKRADQDTEDRTLLPTEMEKRRRLRVPKKSHLKLDFQLVLSMFRS